MSSPLVLLRLANELGNLMASGASAWRELVVREVLATKPGTKPVDEGSCAGEPAATRLTNPHRRQSSRTMSSAPVWVVSVCCSKAECTEPCIFHIPERSERSLISDLASTIILADKRLCHSNCHLRAPERRINELQNPSSCHSSPFS